MIFEQLGSTAIRPDVPAGDEVKGTPAFEALEQEISKLTNPAASSPINWQRVVDLGGGLLANSGKDLRVACYLAYGLSQTRKLEGFNIGLKIIADLVSSYWETMYPPLARIRGRRNAVEWWLERTTNFLRNTPTVPLPLEQLTQLKQRAGQIDAVLKERDPDGPALQPLIAAIRAIPAEEVPSAIPASNEGQQTSPPAASSTSQNPDAALRESMKNIQRAIAELLDSDLTDARLYRLNRTVTWIDVELPATQNGITRIPSPAAEIIAKLNELRAEADGAQAVRFAEMRLHESRLWLDLNRVSAEGLAKIGANAAKAQSAVEIETAGLLRRLPGVELLAFSDGKPLADDTTRKWLQSIALPSSAAPADDGTAPQDSTAETWRKIDTLAAAGKLLDAARAVDEVIRDAVSVREETLARVRLCEIFVASQSPIDPRPYFEPLLETVEHYHLEEWDPELALRALAVALRGIARTADKDSAAKRRAELLKRIAMISSSEALRLSTAN